MSFDLLHDLAPAIGPIEERRIDPLVQVHVLVDQIGRQQIVRAHFEREVALKTETATCSLAALSHFVVDARRLVEPLATELGRFPIVPLGQMLEAWTTWPSLVTRPGNRMVLRLLLLTPIESLIAATYIISLRVLVRRCLSSYL